MSVRHCWRGIQLILIFSSFWLLAAGLDWRHLMIEAHKNRHHTLNTKGASGTFHWNTNSSGSSSGSSSHSNSNSATSFETNQKTPLFDWESSSSSMTSSTSERVQEVTTTLGQTAFLHCRVRYLADRRVSSFSFQFFFRWFFSIFFLTKKPKNPIKREAKKKRKEMRFKSDAKPPIWNSQM